MVTAHQSAQRAAIASPASDEPRRAPERILTTRYGYEMKPTGERFEFAASARTSADKRFRFVWTLAPGKTGPGEHFHPGETESFEIVSGRIRIWVNGAPNDYGPGDVCVVPAGVRHRFLNPTGEPVVINVSLDGTPMEDSLVPIALATYGRKSKLSDFLRLFSGFDAGASVPASGGERAVMKLIPRLLRALGLKPFPPVIGWDGPEHHSSRGA